MNQEDTSMNIALIAHDKKNLRWLDLHKHTKMYCPNIIYTQLEQRDFT